VQEANAAVADESDPTVAEEDKAPDDDKTFAAMGVAKTIGTVSSCIIGEQFFRPLIDCRVRRCER
jgi:hypothetical protein